MKKFSDIASLYFENLKKFYPEEEIQSFLKIITHHYFGWRAIDLALKSQDYVSEEEELLLLKVLNRLKKQEPIQYIVGQTYFYGLPIKVTPNTLIPRPETEELVDWVISTLQDRKETQNQINIIDIGTGTGCIAIALAKNIPKANVEALDISIKALEVAQENALLNEVEITFTHKNILQTNDLQKNYDVIISNPPYVRQLEKKLMQINVLDYEPSLALYVPDDNALLFYKKITQLASQHLTQNGLLFFEINQYLGEETIKLLKKNTLKEVILKKDIFGKNRFVKGYK